RRRSLNQNIAHGDAHRVVTLHLSVHFPSTHKPRPAPDRPEQGGGPDQRPGLVRGTLAVRPQRPGIDSGRIGRLSIPEASMPESIPAPLIIDTLKDTFRDARAALAAEGVRPRHEHLGWILSVPDTHQTPVLAALD